MHFSVTCLHGPCHSGCSLGPPYAAAQTSVRGPGTLLSSSSAFADLGLPQGLVHRSQASYHALGQSPHSQSLPALWWDCGNTVSSTRFFLDRMRRVRFSWQGFVVEGDGDQEPSCCVVSLRPLFPAQPIRRDTWGSTLHPAQHLCLGRPWPFLVRPLLGQLLLGEPQMAEPDPGGHPSLSLQGMWGHPGPCSGQVHGYEGHWLCPTLFHGGRAGNTSGEGDMLGGS